MASTVLYPQISGGDVPIIHPTSTVRLWDEPSGRVAELIRKTFGELLDNPKYVYDAIDSATLAASRSIRAAGVPDLDAAIRASVRANISHWLTANYKAPGMPVSANLCPENVELAREVVRHGFAENILANFHAGQNKAVQIMIELVFGLTQDPAELHELLSVLTRSAFAYVDDTQAALYELIERERGQLTDSDRLIRLETVELVLTGAPIDVRLASRRLHYELDRTHLAAIVWSDIDPADPRSLEHAVHAMATALGTNRPLTIPASQSTLWVWAGYNGLRPTEIRRALDAAEGVRMAVGSPGRGVPGFLRSHLDALATQRIMRRLPGDTKVQTYDEIDVIALVTADEERALEFVARTLGNLASAEPELRETLRVFLREGSSPTRTARALFAHRNTINSRLERARALLPAALDQRPLQVAVALEIVRVLGPG